MDIVIGGGITGLSFAYFSKKNPPLILEKENELGGYCRTTKRNGYVWDYSGHFFHFQDSNIKNIIMDGIDTNTLKKVDKSTKISFKNSLIDFPFQKNIHQLPKEDFIDCLYDLYNAPKEDFHTFKEMLYTKFGKSIAEKFLVPYNEKLYSCNLNKLDKDAMGRFFPFADIKDIVSNFRKADNSSYNGSFLYPEGGAEVYVKSLQSKIAPDRIELDSEVESIDINNRELILSSGKILMYDRLISTLPLPELLKKCGMEYEKDAFSWNQVLVFNLGFNKKASNTSDHWIYFPNKQISFYRIGFYDNILDTDKLSMYIEIGFPQDAKINPNEWLGNVLKDLRDEGIIDDTFSLVDFQSIIMNPAYVHISEQSIRETEKAKKELEKYGIYSIGRYGSWTYCSIEDNIKEAKNLAEKIN